MLRSKSWQPQIDLALGLMKTVGKNGPGIRGGRPLVLLSFLLIGAFSAEAKQNSGFTFDFGFGSKQHKTHCPPGHILIEKPEGSICKLDMSYLYKKNSQNSVFQSRQALEMIVPDITDVFTPEEKRCFSQQKIYWSPDGICYPLLQKGPCQQNEWLVASQETPSYSNRFSRFGERRPPTIKISCKPRKCPCLASDPDMCEVEPDPTHPELRQHTHQNCRSCVTALAAEQDGICQSGEQLITSPYGFGICGCRLRPKLHVNYLDNRCYPLHEKGPCNFNETLHWNPENNSPICVPSVCPQGLVLSPIDGKCHSLGTQGPCQNPEDVYQIDPVTRQPKCVPREGAKVKRIFDVLPSNLQDNGDASFGANMLNCLGGSNKCLTTGSNGVSGSRGHVMSTITDPRMGKRLINENFLKTKMSDPAEYIKWLRSFRN